MFGPLPVEVDSVGVDLDVAFGNQAQEVPVGGESQTQSRLFRRFRRWPGWRGLRCRNRVRFRYRCWTGDGDLRCRFGERLLPPGRDDRIGRGRRSSFRHRLGRSLHHRWARRCGPSLPWSASCFLSLSVSPAGSVPHRRGHRCRLLDQRENGDKTEPDDGHEAHDISLQRLTVTLDGDGTVITMAATLARAVGRSR